jgi:hypothetical protein
LEEGYSIPPGFKPELLEGDRVSRIMETLVARKTLFEKIGQFNPNLRTAEDVDWFARAKDKNILMAVIPEVLLYKRIHDANISLSDIKLNNDLLLNILKQSIDRQRSRRGEKE